MGESEKAEVTPEDFLARALRAKTPEARGRYARRGLATRRGLDRTTQAMLLRQLYLSHYEARKFQKAEEIALQALELEVLPDVLHQDVARAAIARGELEIGLEHLRKAARKGPASRRPFHWWTLGSTLFMAKRYEEAASALERAIRWGTRDRPLYRAHLGLVRVAMGQPVVGLQELVNELVESACGQGYGRFILGHLAYVGGAWPAARKYLDGFVKKIENSRPSIAIALEAEVEMAKATLLKISAN